MSRWTTNPVSLIELSFQVSVRLVAPGLAGAASPSGLIGGIATVTGRIMSISSWLRIWQ